MGNRDSVLLAFYGCQRSDPGEDDPRNSSGAQSIGPVQARTDRPPGGSDKTNVASICGWSLTPPGRHFIRVRTGPD